MQPQVIKTGSLKELWCISYPLMISFLSIMMMVFVDRIFLSFYSANALNAATSAGTLCWSFTLGWTTLASLSEVFVAQYNGAKQYKKIAEPIWQMIWFSALSIFFFIPGGIFGADWIYGVQDGTNHENSYFLYTMLFAPFSVLLATLSAFYVGQGKTSIIKWMALLGNLINVILDPIFIFGVQGYIPSMGVKGACIATGIGTLVQAVILFVLFLKKHNRETYKTGNWSFNSQAFKQCVKIGLPPAIFIFLELLGWAIFYWMMAKISPSHILVASICQSILILFVFFGFGLEKGSATVAGNLIGSQNLNQVKNVISSGLKLICLFAIVLAVCLLIFPDVLIEWFFKNPQAFDVTDFNVDMLSTENLLELKRLIRFGLVMTAIYIVLEDCRWLLSGILTAAGDTMFLMLTGVASVWLFLIAPTYFFILKPEAGIDSAFIIWIVYSFVTALLNLIRYRQGKWKTKQLITITPSEELPIEDTVSSSIETNL